MAILLRRRDDNAFFGALAALCVTLVGAGFARTFYIHGMFGQPAPTLLITIHGSVMTGWIGLYAFQTWLVAARNIKWHRWLGWAGVCCALSILPLGFLATTGAAAREIRAHSAYVDSQLDVLGLELMQLALFSTFVAWAVALRRRADWHKRLMSLATLCILPNAIVRLCLLVPLQLFSMNIFILSLWALLVLAIVGADCQRTAHLHPAYAYGAGIALGGLYLAHFASTTHTWRSFVEPHLQ
jgi:hypothetical protein